MASAVAGPDLHSFAGTWQGQFNGKTFVTLKLIERDLKIDGYVRSHDGPGENARGELTHVDETQTEDPIVEAHLKESELQISIADNGSTVGEKDKPFRMLPSLGLPAPLFGIKRPNPLHRVSSRLRR